MTGQTTSYRDEQIAARVASGANDSAGSAAWSIDYQAGYSAGQSDARRLVKRDYSGACEAWSAGYDRGWTWTLAH